MVCTRWVLSACCGHTRLQRLGRRQSFSWIWILVSILKNSLFPWHLTFPYQKMYNEPTLFLSTHCSGLLRLSFFFFFFKLATHISRFVSFNLLQQPSLLVDGDQPQASLPTCSLDLHSPINSWKPWDGAPSCVRVRSFSVKVVYTSTAMCERDVFFWKYFHEQMKPLIGRPLSKLCAARLFVQQTQGHARPFHHALTCLLSRRQFLLAYAPLALKGLAC